MYASQNCRTSFSENNLTKQDLKHYVGLIIVENKTVDRMTILSDYFQEQNRIQAKRNDDQSPEEYFEKNPNKTRDEIKKNVKECTNFCPTIIGCLIKLFHSKNILDFSSGWGDRLVGAMLFDRKIKRYVGIDPNKKLHTGYKNMIKLYLPKHSHSKYEMICGCAEDELETINEKFDLVCTSPPYFDLEVYDENDENQSVKRFPEFENWYNNFLLKCINLSGDKLLKGGMLAININDFGKYNIVDRLINDMNKNIELKFNGIIYFGNPKCKTQIYQPILMWEKK